MMMMMMMKHNWHAPCIFQKEKKKRRNKQKEKLNKGAGCARPLLYLQDVLCCASARRLV